MDGYVALGCEPTWTCAPYQAEIRPAFGEQIAWAESNAIVFANSVLGARTHRYGDFIDIAAAVTARVPDAGLHHAENRTASVVVDVTGLSPVLRKLDAMYPCLGFVIGRRFPGEIPAIVGLPSSTSEDDLKALGAAAASSGNLAMFHAVGITPEAPTLAAACGGVDVVDLVDVAVVTAADIRDARDQLSTHSDQPLATVSLGTPHYSLAEIERLHQELGDKTIAPSVAFYVSTARAVLHEAMLRGWITPLRNAGVTFVTDTCTYITPIVKDTTGLAMTDSAKWAYYAPGNIGVDAVFGALTECVQSAVAGRVVRDEGLWGDGVPLRNWVLLTSFLMSIRVLSPRQARAIVPRLRGSAKVPRFSNCLAFLGTHVVWPSFGGLSLFDSVRPYTLAFLTSGFLFSHKLFRAIFTFPD